MSSSPMNPFGVALGLRPHIIRAAALAFGDEVAFFDEFLEAEFEGAGFAAGELDELSESEGFVIGEEGDDFPGERVEVGGVPASARVGLSILIDARRAPLQAFHSLGTEYRYLRPPGTDVKTIAGTKGRQA